MLHPVYVVASTSLFKQQKSKDAQVVEWSEHSIPEIDLPPAGATAQVFSQLSVSPLRPHRRCFLHRKQRHPKVGPAGTGGHFATLLDFSVSIEEVCGLARGLTSAS